MNNFFVRNLVIRIFDYAKSSEYPSCHELLLFYSTKGRILNQVNNIVSRQHEISPQRVLLIFATLFIEGI